MNSNEPRDEEEQVGLADPRRLSLHRTWTVYCKKNTSNWSPVNFVRLCQVTTVAELWGLVHALPDKLAGCVNIFVMEGSLLPLYEKHLDIFGSGGTHSVVVKGTKWISAFAELMMSLLGESTFDEHIVRGACVVPVGAAQCIVKLWATSNDKRIGKQLELVFQHFGASSAQFKQFKM